MYSEEIGQSIQIQLKNTAYSRFENDSSYPDIISPFSRMYYIEEGKGELIFGENKVKLEGGMLYLIPSFTPCTYIFDKDLSHFYIHFSISMRNGLSPYHLYSIKNKVPATATDIMLFQHLIEVVPDLKIPHHDPNVYQKKVWLSKKVNYTCINQHLETIGIIYQLFSRFIDHQHVIQTQNLLRHNIQPILKYIQNNIANDISVQELAEMAFLSNDHFSRIFKSITGFAPSEYVIHKRIEKAQLLLLTTDLTLNQIMEETNFKSASYFSRLFKKCTSYTPRKYRELAG